MYTIVLSDGTKLENLELNGNNFISEVVLDNAVFEDKLKTVTISNGETEEVYSDMVLISNRVEDGHSWFILAEKTAEQKAAEEIAETFTNIEMALAEVYETMLGGV